MAAPLPPPQIKDARSAYRGDVDIPDLDEPPEERELDLKPFASAWDLKMFREAKVRNSKKPSLRNPLQATHIFSSPIVGDGGGGHGGEPEGAAQRQDHALHRDGQVGNGGE